MSDEPRRALRALERGHREGLTNAELRRLLRVALGEAIRRKLRASPREALDCLAFIGQGSTEGAAANAGYIIARLFKRGPKGLPDVTPGPNDRERSP